MGCGCFRKRAKVLVCRLYLPRLSMSAWLQKLWEFGAVFEGAGGCGEDRAVELEPGASVADVTLAQGVNAHHPWA